MKYIDEINAFHDWLCFNQISQSAVALWYALMHLNNKCGWKSEFNASNMMVSVHSGGLSIQSIHRGRNTLKQAGLIDFKVRPGQQSTIYKINSFAIQNGKQTDQVTDQATDQVTDDIPRLRQRLRLDSNKESKPKKKFVKPTLEEVRAYCLERNNTVPPEKFMAYYESKGWLVGKSPMKDWKASVRTWEMNNYDNNQRRDREDSERTKYTWGEG